MDIILSLALLMQVAPFASLEPLTCTISTLTETHSTFLTFKHEGPSAGRGCWVSVAQLCHRRPDLDRGRCVSLYGGTVTHKLLQEPGLCTRRQPGC